MPNEMPVSTNFTCSSCKSFINDSKRWSGSDLTSVIPSAPSSLNDLSIKYLVKKWSSKQVDVIGRFEIGITKSSINEYLPWSACTVFLTDEFGEFAVENIDLFGFSSLFPCRLCTEQSCPLRLDSNVETIYTTPFVYIFSSEWEVRRPWQFW